MFKKFKYVPAGTPLEQSMYALEQIEKNAGCNLILEDYRRQIEKAIKNKNDVELLVTLEGFFLEELTLEEAILVKNIDIDVFMQNYVDYAVLGFNNCCYK